MTGGYSLRGCTRLIVMWLKRNSVLWADGVSRLLSSIRSLFWLNAYGIEDCQPLEEPALPSCNIFGAAHYNEPIQYGSVSHRWIMTREMHSWRLSNQALCLSGRVNWPTKSCPTARISPSHRPADSQTTKESITQLTSDY